MKRPSPTFVFSTLASTVTLLTVVALGCIGWAYLFERPFLAYTNLPFPAAPTVHAGESVALEVTRCSSSRMRRSYITTHQLRNEDSGQVVLLPDVLVDIEPGCISSLSLINVVPAATAPGRYTVAGLARVDGLVVIHRVSWASAPFQVLPALPAKEN